MVQLSPQQVFALILREWDDIDEYTACGICSKINLMYRRGLICWESQRKADRFLLSYQSVAIDDFGARPMLFWWEMRDQESRKRFVKYLSEIPLPPQIELT